MYPPSAALITASILGRNVEQVERMKTSVMSFHTLDTESCRVSRFGCWTLQAFAWTYAYMEKSRGLRSGELGGKTSFGQKFWFSNSHSWTSLEVWQRAPSCMKINSDWSWKFCWIHGRMWGFKTRSKYPLAPIQKPFSRKTGGILRPNINSWEGCLVRLTVLTLSGTSWTLSFVMYLSDGLLQTWSTEKYFSSVKRMTGNLFFIIAKILLHLSSLRLQRRSVSKNLLLLAKEQALIFFLAMFLMVCSLTLSSLARLG